MKRMQGHGCWKASFSVKVSKCNFKSKAQVHEGCFFLMKWNVICNAEDSFHVLEFFAEQVMLELQCTESLFRASKTLMLCLVQLSKWRECKATDAEKLLSQWEKVANAILWIKLKYIKMFLSHEINVICNAEDSFHVLELFCRASHVRASMHRITNLELLRTLCCV